MRKAFQIIAFCTVLGAGFYGLSLKNDDRVLFCKGDCTCSAKPCGCGGYAIP